jgi:hypothetical protein
MILTPEETSILLSNKEYNGQLIEKQMGKRVFADTLSPLGNILCFQSPVNISGARISDALVFNAQLPFTNNFGGVCFQRLYTAQLGGILCEALDKNVTVDGYTLFLEENPVTITSQNKVQETFLFMIIIPLVANEHLSHVELSEEQTEIVKRAFVNCFYSLTESIFEQIQNDNI